MAALNDADILHRLEALEAKYTEVTAKNAEITRKNAEIQAENAEIQATLNATATGELKVFNADECPPGWVEFNKTQGYLLTGRPKDGETGTTINRPMDAGEKGRSPEHSHEVGVEDLGHTHETVVNDPGHMHPVTAGYGSCDCTPEPPGDQDWAWSKSHGPRSTNNATTGIVRRISKN